MDLYMPRHVAETPAMIFLSQFRELIRGQPKPGGPCQILYDPSRIVPAVDYDRQIDSKDHRTRSVRFMSPETEVPVTAHIQFQPNGPILEVPLSTESGPLRDAVIRRDGRGTMLYGSFKIPDEAEWIMVWFTHIDLEGKIHYDSRFGANYTFRFIEREIRVLEATIEPLASGTGHYFRCKVETAPFVNSVLLRYQVVNYPPEPPPVNVTMLRDPEQDKSGRIIWTSGDIVVPHRAVIAFDLVYFVHNRSFKEDNQGTFFIVSELSTDATPTAAKPH